MNAAASTATNSAQILHHTSQFVSKTFSQSELRHGLISAFRHKSPKSSHVTLKQLSLAAETLEKAIATTNPAARSSSLRLAGKLLRPYPHHPFSLFLQSLTLALSLQPLESSVALLDMFGSDPSLSRSEIAPSLFEELFLVHLLPVLQSFNDRRSRILSSLLADSGHNGGDESLSGTKSLSRMSGNQTSELKRLETAYEEVIDENCQVLVKYFKEVLLSKIGDGPISPPYLIPKKIGEDEQLDCSDDDDDDQIGTDELGNGRYNNPMWAAEGEGSVEFYRSKSKSPPFYPQRVSLNILKNHESLSRLKASPNIDSASEAELSLEDTSANSSSESEAEPEVNNRKMSLFHPSPGETSRSPDRLMANFDNPPGGGKNTPPKDFVCPITSNVFNDPVTLETGQTYERKAIQEWIDRGNSSCPITRQMLHSTQLPKTNYVLKRLIASWQECNPEPVLAQSEPDPDPDPVAKSIMPATSPNSVISQANIDGMLGELRHAITNLCMSEILQESETAVLRIEQFWWEGNEELDIQSMLSKPAVINGFVEILFNSVDPRVLKATIFLLSELGSRERVVIQTLTQVDSDVECIVALFKNGLLEASVLIYLLRPSTISLVEMDMVESLFYVIKKREEDLLKMSMKPKTAAILLLGQILGSSEESMVSSIARAVVSAKVVENVIGSLGSEMAEERIAAVGILLRCMVEDGLSRNIIADKAELAPVLESFMSAHDDQRFQIVQFLSELVKLNKRTFNEQILHIIKDEGAFSTMHSLLIYLQAALPYQCPAVAGLLLQLDLLVEPRKMSIYREEAIDTLIACLRNSEYPAAQIAAAETIVSLHGRFSVSGEPLARAFLLKRAGLEKNYKAFMRLEKSRNSSGDFEDVMEEEKAAEDWERKVAFALVSHEFGLLFEALAEGLKSRYAELCSACFVSATWLVHMLTVLPDTGIRGAARLCLLKRFISIFKSAKDTEDRALSVLAMRSFMQDPEGMRDLTFYMKDILKGLRDLKKSSHLAFEMLKLFSEGNDSSTDMWSHKELIQVDCSENGEVLSIVCFRDKIFSGHTDGTIKVWTGRGSILHLLQETREHTKAVTSLAILQSGDKLYSGSLDKTTRVWSISNNVISCVQVHDMKDQVHSLVVSNSISCFIPQGAGVKVHSWNGGSKLVNSSKHVKALALVHGKLYCGCHDSSIQEVDLATGTLGTIQSGSRKLLAKSNPVHALQAHNGLIYSATSPLDGAAVKIWSASNYSMVGSLACTQEVRTMAISSDLIYLGCKGGAIEIWCREKQSRVDTLQTGTNSKILAMALDASEEILVTGTSDGRIQAWGLS